MLTTIRKMQPADRESVLSFIQATAMFTPAEVEVAMELIDIYLHNPQQKDYIVEVAVNTDNEAVGYVCYGPTPATDGTYDLYWIVVHPRYQGKGVGKQLLLHVEDMVRRSAGRLIIIETSSLAKYASTRQFYLNNAYVVAAQIKDFYRVGDDRVIFTKYL